MEKHGTKRRRAWRVLHLATDADTGRIVASVLTDKDADDGSQVGPLLDQVDGPVASFTGDGAYDRDESMPKSRPAIPLRPWSCPRARMRCRAKPQRARRRSATGICDASPSAAAWAGSGPQGTTGALSWSAISRDGNVSSVTAYVPDRRATGNRGGDRCRRAEPNAGAGTPGIRPHRITRNTGRAQCAHTADPCNKVSSSSWICGGTAARSKKPGRRVERTSSCGPFLNVPVAIVSAATATTSAAPVPGVDPQAPASAGAALRHRHQGGGARSSTVRSYAASWARSSRISTCAAAWAPLDPIRRTPRAPLVRSASSSAGPADRAGAAQRARSARRRSPRRGWQSLPARIARASVVRSRPTAWAASRSVCGIGFPLVACHGKCVPVRTLRAYPGAR